MLDTTGVDRVCLLLYGRNYDIPDLSDKGLSKILHDAARKIESLSPTLRHDRPMPSKYTPPKVMKKVRLKSFGIMQSSAQKK